QSLYSEPNFVDLAINERFHHWRKYRGLQHRSCGSRVYHTGTKLGPWMVDGALCTQWIVYAWVSIYSYRHRQPLCLSRLQLDPQVGLNFSCPVSGWESCAEC